MADVPLQHAVMPLEKLRRYLVVDLALHGAANDGRLVLAGGEDGDLAGLENRGDG